VLLLIGLDQRGQNLQTILIVTARLGSVHEHVDLLKSLLQILLRTDGGNLNSSRLSLRLRGHIRHESLRTG
jgi:hypothetical protein